jgi:hypothetical protein
MMGARSAQRLNQYEYRQLMEQFGMKVLMSRRGSCYDSAPMQGFWTA